MCRVAQTIMAPKESDRQVRNAQFHGIADFFLIGQRDIYRKIVDANCFLFQGLSTALFITMLITLWITI